MRCEDVMSMDQGSYEKSHDEICYRIVSTHAENDTDASSCLAIEANETLALANRRKGKGCTRPVIIDTSLLAHFLARGVD
jgi:hypothetical protein